MIIGMDRCFAAALSCQKLIGPAGNDFIHIHVGGCAGPGLKDVNPKLVLKIAVLNLLGRLDDCLG